MQRFSWSLTLIILVAGCGPETKKDTIRDRVILSETPAVLADSAFSFVETQLKFGPRIPNTPPHQITGDYLIKKLKQYGARITVQEFEAQTFDAKTLRLRNIIATFYPEKQKRILLSAHWDTRPFADKDKEKKDAPFDGANDGASGVGVLLEIARALHQGPAPQVGVDIILFDGEDWGERDDEPMNHNLPPGFDSWWCLGSQYWARNKHQPNYSAYYGILLDMVGAKGSNFFREGNSLKYAPRIVEKVWNTAGLLGYSHIFVTQNAGGIMDDHLIVNDKARIPMINIVHYEPGVGYFGDYHHSRKDNLDLIDKQILQAVAKVVIQVIYNEE